MAYLNLNLVLQKVSAKEVFALEKELVLLYNMEVFERDLYFQELRKFDGKVFETIKWLSQQEEAHVNILEQVLSRANILMKESSPKLPKLSKDTKEILKMDIGNEKQAVMNYTNTINKTNGALKEILTQIMQEELNHIERLEKYVEE